MGSFGSAESRTLGGSRLSMGVDTKRVNSAGSGLVTMHVPRNRQVLHWRLGETDDRRYILPKKSMFAYLGTLVTSYSFSDNVIWVESMFFFSLPGALGYARCI